MSHVVVLGAGLGGTIMAYELRKVLGREHRVTVVNRGATYSFVPSNPWVAVGWRGREDISVDIEPILKKRGLFRTEYSGRTLREHLGIALPGYPGHVPAADLHSAKPALAHVD